MQFKHFRHVNQLRFCLVPTYDIMFDISSDPFTLLLTRDSKTVGTFYTIKTLYRWLLYKEGAAWMIDRGLIIPERANNETL